MGVGTAVTSGGRKYGCGLGRRLPQTGRPNGPGQGGGEGWREGAHIGRFPGREGGGEQIGVCACVCACVSGVCVCAFPMCVQVSFCLQLIKLLPTVCCGQRMGFWGEALSLSSRSPQSSWWRGNVCATVSVICVYLGSCFCPELYILWGLACRFQNMPGPSPGVAMGLGLRPPRVLGGGRVRMRLSMQVYPGSRVTRWTSHCGWVCLHVSVRVPGWLCISSRVSVCPRASACRSVGPWVYLVPP